MTASEGSAEAYEDFLEMQECFRRHLNRLGRIGIVYRLRRVHPGCWDWGVSERGLRLLDDRYRELACLPWPEALALLEEEAWTP